MGAFAGEGGTVNLLLVVRTLKVFEPGTLIWFADLRKDARMGQRGGGPAGTDRGGLSRKDKQNNSEHSRESHRSTLNPKTVRWRTGRLSARIRQEMDAPELWDVIVLGAGIAGLACARMLAEAGRHVLVLEASNRVGGRIRTERQDGVPVELGAEFVHGRPPELWALIEEAGLTTYEKTGSLLTAQDGHLQATDREEDEDDPLEGLKNFAEPDCSFLEYLDRLGLEGDQRAEAIGYAEGYNTADASEVSVLALARQQRAEDEIEGDRLWKVAEGYDRLPEYVYERLLAAGGEVRLRMTVDAVAWERGRVTVTAGGREFTARQCVIALPLGVLQAGTVQISPEPGEVLRAAKHMRMGQVFRMSLVFGERLWPEEMSFLFTRDRMPPVWWTSDPGGTSVLTAWAGGPRATELLRLNEAEQVEAVCGSLAAALALQASEVRKALTGVHVFDWQRDPLSRGAYSWVPVGGLEASAAMSQPVEDTLFFAGEHTDLTGHWGTVHAALGSGLRVAQQLLTSGSHVQTSVAVTLLG